MFKKITNKLSFRKGFITGVSLLILLNLICLSLYYKIVLSNDIKRNYQITMNELQEEEQTLAENLSSQTDIDSYLEEYSQNNNLKITLKNEENNEKEYLPSKTEKYNITISDIIKIDDSYYLLSLYKSVPVITFKVFISFFIFEFVLIIFLTLFGIGGANFKILSPITELSNDFDNYKLGILPKKRKKRGKIDQLQNDFVDLVDTLEEEKKNQSRIIASISHDIKTPLTSILGYSERLSTSEKLSDETKKKYALKIYNKSLVMKEIIEEFDNYLSCNIKNSEEEQQVIIKDLINYLNEYYKDELKEKNISLKISTNCNEKIILVDYPKIKRVFANIITNSLRHLNKEKKLININISSQKDDKIRIEIADNGSGTQEDLKKIFKPLYTTDKSRKISGLGLAICKEIITSHNGSIRAFNNKMGGLTIEILLDEYKENENERTTSI